MVVENQRRCGRNLQATPLYNTEWRGWSLKNTPLPICYRNEFGRPRSYDVGINRGSQKLWGLGPFGMGRGWPLKYDYTTLPKLTVLGQTVQGHRWKYAGKWPLASHLSRSLKVIGTDTDRSATCDFLLVIHSNTAYLVPFPRYNEIVAENCEFFLLPVYFTLVNGSMC